MSCIAVRRTAGILSQHQLSAVAMYSLTSFQQTSCSTQQGLSQTCADAGPAGPTPAHQSQQRRAYAADAPEPLMDPLAKQQQPQSPATMQRQEVAVVLPDSNQGPWERVIDKPTGQPYWWNAESGVTTPVGASKPDAWVAVVDPQTKAQYFWNKDSGETTAVGEPLPGPEGRLAAHVAAAQQQQQGQAPSAMSVLTNSLAMGFGMGLMFAIARMLF